MSRVESLQWQGRAELGQQLCTERNGNSGEREHDHRAGEGGVGHLAEKGGLRRADGIPGQLILFLLGSSSGDVQRPSLANRAQPSPCGQPAGQISFRAGEAMGLWCSLGRRALHSDLKHFGKSQNKQEKPNKLGLQLDTLVLSSV